MRRSGERRKRFDGRVLLQLYEQETGGAIAQEQFDAWWSEIGGEVDYVQQPPRHGVQPGLAVARDPGPPSIYYWLPADHPWG